MPIAMTTDESNQTTVVVTEIETCVAVYACGLSWLRITDTHNNKLHVHLPPDLVARLHETWAATATRGTDAA